MSSESLDLDNKHLYWWNPSLKLEDYIVAEFYIETSIDPELAALGMAREQSSCATRLNGYRSKLDLEAFTARIIKIESRGISSRRILDNYWLNTAVYSGPPEGTKEFVCADIAMAFPVANCGNSLVGLWSTVPGEIFRLGFLNTVKLRRLRLPETMVNAFAGPRHGIGGIRQKLRIKDRPIFCRSCRPAVSLYTSEIVEINRRVLRGGFDVVKDDELTFDSQRSPFHERVKAMMAMKREVEDQTGELKLYFANITADQEEAFRQAEIAAEAGVDGLLASPQLQGVSFVREIRKRFDQVIMAHNSCEDILYRHPLYGVSSEMVFMLHRLAGADLMILTADFTSLHKDPIDADAQLQAVRGPLGNCQPALPVIAGGKTPQNLSTYVQDLGGVDFMIIAATAVDNHPDGLEAGARAFREAWDHR